MDKRVKYKNKRKNSGGILFILLTILLLLAGGACWFIFSDNEENASVNKTKNVAAELKDASQKDSKDSVDKIREEPASHDYSILIKKSEFKLYLLDNGNFVEGYACALGKNVGQKTKRGDMKTPNGVFLVDEIIDASAWTHDFKDGKGEIAGAYGPWFISLDTFYLSKGAWDGIGIHGTHDPSSIGTLASEGCIRLDNKNLEKLKQYVKVGTKVTIEE